MRFEKAWGKWRENVDHILYSSERRARWKVVIGGKGDICSILSYIWIAARTISVSRHKNIPRSCSTVCHFEMASLGLPIEAPVGRAFANSQLITFSFTLSFLQLSKNFSRVESFFLQQTLWRNHEMEWDRVHILLNFKSFKFSWNYLRETVEAT